MPAIKSVVPSLDDLAENLREFYEEKDGKFYLQLEGVREHPEVTALANALERMKTDRRKESAEIKSLREKAAKLPEDFDPDVYATMKAKLEEYEADPDKRTDDKQAKEAVAARKMLEDKITGMEKKHTAETDKLKKQITDKDQFIGQLLIDDGLTKALVEVGIDKNFMKAAKALLRQDVKVVEEDGAYRAIVESDTGVLDIPRYVSDWVASDEGKAFIPPAKGGDAGAPAKPSKPVVTDSNPWSKEKWNLTEQGKLIRGDRARAEKLAKAAGHTLPPALA